jgi:tight adherence protein B
MNRRGAPVRPPIDDVADRVQRVAVLLAAGVAPATAWGYLDDVRRGEAASRSTASHSQAVSEAVVAAANRAALHGGDVPGAIAAVVRARPLESASRGVSRPGTRRGTRRVHPRGHVSRGPLAEVQSAWLGLAAALQVATQSGAPLADALRRTAAALRDLGQAQRDREAALAGPRATARTVLMLPAIGLVFGATLGFDTVHVLVATPLGLGCLGVGLALLAGSAGWNRALVRGATPRDHTPGLAIDLLAIAMSGGGSVPDARRRVEAACERFGIEPPAEHAVGSVLDLAQRAGVGTVELLRAEAEQARRDACSAAQRASAALGVRLMMPLAVCVLPAFMLLSVAPLVISIVSTTFGSTGLSVT